MRGNLIYKYLKRTYDTPLEDFRTNNIRESIGQN